jgi:hypothetical protein
MGTRDEIPTIKTPVERFYMGNMMIYPELGNGEAVTRFATKVVQQVQTDLPGW